MKYRTSWYNAEGYFDPTAGQAIDNVLREERKKKELENVRVKQSPQTNKKWERKRTADRTGKAGSDGITSRSTGIK